MSANVIESFFVALGFEIDTKELDGFSSKMEDAKDTVLGISKVAGIAAAAVGAFITKIGYGIDDLGDFAEAEQVAVETITELGHAAQLSGSDLNAVKASISGVNKVVGEAVMGIGRGAMTFDKLGMSAKNADGSVKSFDQILEEVSDKMQGMSRQEAIAMAEKLGIDRTLIPMLLKGKEHIAALREEARALGSVTAEDAEKAGQFADAMDRTHFMLYGLAKQIAVNLMPAMTNMLDGMRKWLLANREVVQSTITRFLQFVTMLLGTFWVWIVRAANGLSGLAKWLTTTRTGVVLLASALALIAKAAAYQMFGMVAAGIKLVASALTIANAAALVTSVVIGGIVIALALLLDDYVNWKEGNDSIIGDMLERFPNAGKAVVTTLGAIGAAFVALKWKAIQAWLAVISGAVRSAAVSILAAATISGGFLPMIGMFASVAASAIAAGAAMVFGWMMAIAPIVLVIAAIAAVSYAIYQLWANWGKVTAWIGGAWDAVTKKVTGFINSVLGAITKVGELLGLTNDASNVKVAVGAAGNGAQASAANNSVNAKGGVIGTAGSTSTSTSTVTQTTQITAPITIRSTDPVEAAKEVSKEMERMNRQTTRNGQSAVAL